MEANSARWCREFVAPAPKLRADFVRRELFVSRGEHRDNTVFLTFVAIGLRPAWILRIGQTHLPEKPTRARRSPGSHAGVKGASLLSRAALALDRCGRCPKCGGEHEMLADAEREAPPK